MTLHQQDNKGEWFPVVGEAYWDELAPIRDEWEEDPETGAGEDRRKILDTSGNWPSMPRLMLAKCATMQALRAGWPDQFGGIYVEEEMDRAKVLDLAASEIADRAREESRLLAIAGKDSITCSFGDGIWRTSPSVSSPTGCSPGSSAGSNPEEVQVGGGEPRPAQDLLGQIPRRCPGTEEGD